LGRAAHRRRIAQARLFRRSIKRRQIAIPTVDARDTKAARQRLEENVAQLLRALADLGSTIPEDDRVRPGSRMTRRSAQSKKSSIGKPF
jgi:asparagine synthetase B (glutamine-hydrolysing)